MVYPVHGHWDNCRRSHRLLFKGLGMDNPLDPYPPYYFLFLPIALFLSVLMVKYLAPGAEGHGTEAVIRTMVGGNQPWKSSRKR